jgi:hypothetical protein
MIVRRLPYILLLLLSLRAYGGNHTWLGASSDKISDPDNWSGGSPVGDPEPALIFAADAARFTVVNDLPAFSVKTIRFETGPFILSGAPIALTDGEITNLATIRCDLEISGTLAVRGPETGRIEGAVRGSGRLRVVGGSVTLAGSVSNSYTGGTEVTSGGLVLNKVGGALAVPGDIDARGGGLSIRAPHQIPDDASVRAGGMAIWADETIRSLEISGSVFGRNDGQPSTATLTVGTVLVRGSVPFHPNLRLSEPALVDVSGPGLPGLRVLGKVGVIGGTVTLRGTGGITWTSQYEATTRIDGPATSLLVPKSHVVMTNGHFNGAARTLFATAGSIGSADIVEDVGLGSAVILTMGAPISLNGILSLGDATVSTEGMRTHIGGTILIQNNSTQPVKGLLNGVPEGGVFENRYAVSYVGGDGNDVVVTDLNRPHADLTFTQSPNPAFVGEPMALSVSVTGSAGMPTGSIVVFDSERQAVASADLVSGIASIPFTFERGLRDALLVRYSGDGVYGSSELIGAPIHLTYRKPIITSIDPSAGLIATIVPVTIRGQHFVPELYIGGIYSRDTEFVSSTEIRTNVSVSFGEPTVHHVKLVAPGGEIASDTVEFTGLYEVDPEQRLTFENAAAVARVTPGAKTAWVTSWPDATRQADFVVDTDFDGIVRWPWKSSSPISALWTFVDLTSGSLRIAASGQARSSIQRLPLGSFVVGPNHRVSRLALRLGADTLPSWRVLWARKGIGAWYARAGFNPLGEREITLLAEDMFPLGDSPAPPAAFARDDVIILLAVGAVEGFIPAYAATLVDDDLDASSPGILEVDRRSRSALEKDPSIRLPVKRTSGAAGTVSARFTTRDRTAHAGIQYVATSGVITFAPGEREQWIDIPIINDNVFWGPTTFEVTLSNPIGASLGDETVFVVTVYDDDPPPAVTLRGPTEIHLRETDGPQVITFDLVLTPASTLPTTVQWVGGADIGSGTVVFNPGETSKSVAVTVPGDDVLKADRKYGIDFGANVAPRFVTIFVEDDDLPRVTPHGAQVSEHHVQAHLIVEFASATDRSATVLYRTMNGTATLLDYAETSGSVQLGPTKNSASIFIPIVDDFIKEDPETFTVVFSSIDAELVFSTVTVTIFDNESGQPPPVGIRVSPVVEGNDGATAARFNMHILRPYEFPITIEYNTVPGTAAADIDYQTTVGSVVIEPGETDVDVMVPVLGDRIEEPNEYFGLHARSFIKGVASDPMDVLCLIVDDDGTAPSRRRSVRH